jgi:glycosyltransferase involved in cell wall biosynthesis
VSAAGRSYAVVTPARNEAESLPRLGSCLAQQTLKPTVWVIVENGSADDTSEVAAALAEKYPWTRVMTAPAEGSVRRGGPIARAFQYGLSGIEGHPDVIVKLDADISMDPDYFERLMAAFSEDPSLGMASGMCFEQENDEWVPRHVTGTSVWGAARAYRRVCLDAVLPLEEAMGWDGIDELKANMHGWRTGTLLDLSFRHHRLEGARDGSRWRAWAAQGRAAHYMGYKPWYLVLRALHNARTELSALALVSAYVKATLKREPRCPDVAVRAYLRRNQRVSALPSRAREALGRRVSAS